VNHEEVDAGLARLAEISARKRDLAREETELARALLDTRRFGIRSEVARALGVTTEAVRKKYGRVHTIIK
jgi:hypothetical protein